MTKQRDNQIDIMRGIAIILMVMGHCAFPFMEFIYLFHMAFFFIVSGYCYKASNSDSLENVCGFVWKRIKSLWFVYVLWNAIFVLLNNVFLKLNIYTDNEAFLTAVEGTFASLHNEMTIKEMVTNILKSFLFGGGTTMGGAFWFFESLFMVSIAYVIVDFVIKKIVKTEKFVFVCQAVVAVCFLCVGFLCHLKGFSTLGIDRMLSYYWLFYLGTVLKKSGVDKKLCEKYSILSFACSFVGLVVCLQFGQVYLDTNRYTNPIFFIIVSVFGWILLRSAAQMLEHIEAGKNLLCVVGRNTVAVVVLHFLCFKIVSWIGIVLKGEPSYLLAAFPVLYKGGIWWIAYTIVAIVIPVGLNELRKKLTKRLFANK